MRIGEQWLTRTVAEEARQRSAQRLRERIATQRGVASPSEEEDLVRAEQLAQLMVRVAESLRSGYSFMQAMEEAAESAPPPLGDHVRAFLREWESAQPFEETLSDFATAVGGRDGKLMVAGILLQREIGGEVADMLTSMSTALRDRIAAWREVQAGSAHESP